MIAPDSVLGSKRSDVLAIVAKHGGRLARIFGSEARGDARVGSDIDLLIEMDSGRGYFDLVRMEDELKELLGRSVDVVTVEALSPYMRDRVLAEAIPL